MPNDSVYQRYLDILREFRGVEVLKPHGTCLAIVRFPGNKFRFVRWR